MTMRGMYAGEESESEENLVFSTWGVRICGLLLLATTLGAIARTMEVSSGGWVVFDAPFSSGKDKSEESGVDLAAFFLLRVRRGIGVDGVRDTMDDGSTTAVIGFESAAATTISTVQFSNSGVNARVAQGERRCWIRKAQRSRQLSRIRSLTVVALWWDVTVIKLS